MPDVLTVSICDQEATLSIDSPFLDEAAAIALFVQELLNALKGPLIPELIKVITDIIKKQLKKLIQDIITNVFASFTLYGTIPNPILVITIPNPSLRIIADIDPEKIIAEAEALIAMGLKTLTDAVNDFIQCLVDSLTSSYVVTALLNIIEHFLRAGAIYKMIVDMVKSVAVDLGFSGYVNFTLPTLTLPYIEIPTFGVFVTGPCGFGASATLSAEITTIETFQSKLMAPKMYDVIEPIKAQLEAVLTVELPGMIQGVVSGFSLS